MTLYLSAGYGENDLGSYQGLVSSFLSSLCRWLIESVTTCFDPSRAPQAENTGLILREVGLLSVVAGTCLWRRIYLKKLFAWKSVWRLDDYHEGFICTRQHENVYSNAHASIKKQKQGALFYKYNKNQSSKLKDELLHRSTIKENLSLIKRTNSKLIECLVRNDLYERNEFLYSGVKKTMRSLGLSQDPRSSALL